MKNFTIADMAENEKPIEKLIRYGTGSLSDAELLAILLRTGTKDMNVISLSQLILNADPIHKGLRGLNYQSIEELSKIPGVGNVKAAQIIALTEISKRMSSLETEEKLILSSPDSVAEYLMEEVRYLTKEKVYALFMSASGALLKKKVLSEGTINRSIISPRDILKEAFLIDATAIVLVHNHPSGNPEPSEQDILITESVKRVCDQAQITFLDHIIIGDKTYYSFSKEKTLSNSNR
ncbi:MAG: DNA repair protein RadC [Eubacterium sp.]|nr:DNA repair protein RadC [Eubacterium sp.]